MSFAQSYENAKQLASELLNTEPDRVDTEMRKIGFTFTYRDDKPIFNPINRIDTYNIDEIQDFWDYLPYEMRFYFDSVSHVADIDAMSDEYKFYALGEWVEFFAQAISAGNGLPMSWAFDNDVPQKTLDGAYLYREGYRLFASKSYSDYHDYNLPDDRVFLYSIRQNWYDRGGIAKFRVSALYRIDISLDQANPVLHEVMTAKEVSEQFSVDSTTVRVSIHKGYIPARKSGGTWLLARSDVQKRWGKEVADN